MKAIEAASSPNKWTRGLIIIVCVDSPDAFADGTIIVTQVVLNIYL